MSGVPEGAWSGTDIARAATLACRLEAGAEKPGNVTPRHSFPDMSYRDFVASAEAIGPVMGEAGRRGVGETVLRAVEATRRVARANTNLGTVLLLAPLARAAALVPDATGADLPSDAPPPAGAALREALRGVLAGLDVEDAKLAYRAIRLARAGGMGRVATQDLGGEPDVSLLEAMRLAAARDAVAREYGDDFEITFEVAGPSLTSAAGDGRPLRLAAVDLYLELLARVPDSLLERKFGKGAARQASARAETVLAAGPPGSRERGRAARTLAAWLRERGWNPGTTADLVAAALFVRLLVEGETDGGERVRRRQA